MAERTDLTWNVTNWITIVLMAALGFGILAFAGSVIRKGKSGASTVSSENV